MTTTEAMDRAKTVLALASHLAPASPRNFLDYGADVLDAAKSLTFAQRENLDFDFKSWVVRWKWIYDRFDRLVEADPMLLYEPANHASLAFHSSPALIRYFKAGNRTSKTQSGYAEHWMVATGQHKWRKFGRPPNASFIVAGLPFSTYQSGVFEAKLITGEQENPLSPMFPVNGKWFNHYDERDRLLTIACPDCAEAGKGSGCQHAKSSIRLFSCENGYEVLQGQAYTLGHYDEDTPEEFFNEGRQRLKTSKYPSIIITGTPRHGDLVWEQSIVVKTWKEGGRANLVDPTDPNSAPLCSVHQISMWDAGIVAHKDIQAEMVLLDEFEKLSRIDGEAMPLTKNPVFDRMALHEMKTKYVRPPQRGEIRVQGLVPGEKPEDITEKTPLEFVSDLNGNLRVWQKPDLNEVYVACVDTAAGLVNRDASCCTILRVYPDGLGVSLEMVAQYHGWITPSDYADKLVPLAYWYNSALMVIELTGGLGRAVMLRVREKGYWNLYRERTDHAQIDMQLQGRMGVETSATSKPFMVAALQQFIKERRLQIPCEATLHELTAFEQLRVGAGGAVLTSPRYQGASGTRDDRVMSLAIGASTVISYPQLMYAVQYGAESRAKEKVSKEVSKDMNTVYETLKEDEAARAYD